MGMGFAKQLIYLVITIVVIVVVLRFLGVL